MFVVDLKISDHQSAANFIAKCHAPLTTHFYDKGHFSSTEHLATPEEARECLDLLLELAKTFPKDNPEFVRMNGACFNVVASLMAIAEIKLSEYDKQHILDYTTAEYDSEYLNYACQIRDASIMIRQISDFWDQVTILESYYQEAATLLKRINATSRLRFIKRFRLGYQYSLWLDEIRAKSALIGYDYVPRLCDGINSNYQSNLEFTHPLIFYHHPSGITDKLFPDQQTEDEVRAEWESCGLHNQFGDEKLARLLDLLPGFSMSYFVFHPDTGKQIVGNDRKQQVLATYPELEPYYDKYLTFDLVDNDGNGYVQEWELEQSVRDLAEVFDAKEYLSTANYSRRQTLPRGHAEDNMSAEELSAANAILEFMEGVRSNN